MFRLPPIVRRAGLINFPLRWLRLRKSFSVCVTSEFDWHECVDVRTMASTLDNWRIH